MSLINHLNMNNTSTFTYPVKTREMHSNHFDSTPWNEFKFRDDDIVIGTYAKSGTTWMQQIVCQLIFNGERHHKVGDLSPWLDLRVPPTPVKLGALEAQEHRRFIKTHLPVDALVYSPKAKYIYIARDGRDVVWSHYNHHRNGNEAYYAALNGPGLVGPPMEPPCDDIVEYYRTWLEKDGYPLWSQFENVKSWWDIQHLPNLMLVHFSNLKKDLSGEMRKVAEFLEIPIDESKWDTIVEHCSFEYMKKHSEDSAPLQGAMWKGGANTFIHKGTNGRWQNILSEEDSNRYVDMAYERLGDDCAHWLITGEINSHARKAV